MAVAALIPAAGMGKRMGAGMNKQYLPVGGKPILAHTLKVFEEAPFVDFVFVIVPADEISYCTEAIINRYAFGKVRRIVAGGTERQQSVMNGLLELSSFVADEDVVIIHDGVRPFVPVQGVQRSVEVALSHDGALMAVPVKDTVKIAVDLKVVDTPDRRNLWLAQTPQTFRFPVIMEAHEAARKQGFTGTDDASLVERLGKQVRIVMGDYRNIKITTPEDMLLAEAFLKESQGRNSEAAF
jgi:2-C-methyl-D-erythritol 4-phosphate cytidylyltransferase